jgi:hypothetical protein
MFCSATRIAFSWSRGFPARKQSALARFRSCFGLGAQPRSEASLKFSSRTVLYCRIIFFCSSCGCPPVFCRRFFVLVELVSFSQISVKFSFLALKFSFPSTGAGVSPRVQLPPISIAARALAARPRLISVFPRSIFPVVKLCSAASLFPLQVFMPEVVSRWFRPSLQFCGRRCLWFLCRC